MCGGWRFGATVVSGGLRTRSYVEVTLAHELGHTLGMIHDDGQSSRTA